MVSFCQGSVFAPLFLPECTNSSSFGNFFGTNSLKSFLQRAVDRSSSEDLGFRPQAPLIEAARLRRLASSSSGLPDLTLGFLAANPHSTPLIYTALMLIYSSVLSSCSPLRVQGSGGLCHSVVCQDFSYRQQNSLLSALPYWRQGIISLCEGTSCLAIKSLTWVTVALLA